MTSVVLESRTGVLQCTANSNTTKVRIELAVICLQTSDLQLILHSHSLCCRNSEGEISAEFTIKHEAQ